MSSAVTFIEPTRLDFWQLAKEPDGSYIDPMGPKNCGTHSASRMATRALEGVRQTGFVGQWPPTGYDIRRHCFEANGSRDTTGGVHHGQTKAAVKMLYGVDLANHYGEDFEASLDALDETRAVSYSVRYKRIRDYPSRRGSFTFYENHELVANGVDRARGMLTGVVEPLADGRQAGLYKGPGEYPISLIKAACGELNISSVAGTYRALGFGKAYFQTTKPTGAPPAALRLYRVEITGKTGIYDVPYGTRLGGVSKATYTCTRQKVAGQWWYLIRGPKRSGNLGRWFTTNGNVEAHYA